MSETKERTHTEETRHDEHKRGLALRRPFDELERLYESVFPHGWLREWPSFDLLNPFFTPRAPAVDVIDRDDEIIVRAEVPGLSKEDLKITVTDDTLALVGSLDQEEEEKRENYYYRELRSGSFTRKLTLPAHVDASKVCAKMKDGVLEIKLPKTEPTKRRSVNVEIV
jgi:HSP20 family protein